MASPRGIAPERVLLDSLQRIHRDGDSDLAVIRPSDRIRTVQHRFLILDEDLVSDQGFLALGNKTGLSYGLGVENERVGIRLRRK
jgi:hypothetical protein